MKNEEQRNEGEKILNVECRILNYEVENQE
jgi:hypothetical protein